MITPIFQVMKFMILFRWEVVNAAVVSVSLKTSEMHVSDADSSRLSPLAQGRGLTQAFAKSQAKLGQGAPSLCSCSSPLTPSQEAGSAGGRRLDGHGRSWREGVEGQAANPK